MMAQKKKEEEAKLAKEAKTKEAKIQAEMDEVKAQQNEVFSEFLKELPKWCVTGALHVHAYHQINRAQNGHA